MKKFFVLFLVFCCLMALISCSAELSDSGKDILNPHFTGEVLERYEKSCLLKITDIGNTPLAVGDKVVVSTNIQNCPEYAVGDSLIVVFNGEIAKSYPPQILNPTIISKT